MDDRFVAMIPLETAAAVNPADVVAAFDRLFPGLAGRLVRAGGGDLDEDRGSGFYMLDGMPLPVMVADDPIDDGAMENAIRASGLWDDAASMRRHEGHVVVSRFEDIATFQIAADTARAVTLLTAAIVGAAPAVGVYWVTGETVTSPDMFTEAAQLQAGEGRPPESVWVQCTWMDGLPRLGRRTLAAFTTGLQPFVGRELEFKPARLPRPLFRRHVIETIGYLLTNGPVLKDGDTLDIGAGGRIRADFQDSGRRPDIPVISVTFEAA